MNRQSGIRTALKWAKSDLGRDVTKSELVGVLLLVGSLVLGLVASGLRSHALGIVAGAAFVLADVVLLLGGRRAI